MQPSLEGLAVCIVLLLIGALMRASLTIGLMASLAFGSTAIAVLPALGGASPLIYTVFTFLLITSLLLHKNAKQLIATLFRHSASAWSALALILYAALGAYILPRLFAGEVTVFAVSHETGSVFETVLVPTSSNLTQAGYLTLGLLTFLVLRIRLRRRSGLRAMRRSFFAMAAFNALLGVVDLVAKLAGAGDVLLPIRTATYAFLTDTEQAGFARIVGGYSEASAFGAAGLASLAFAFTHWRATGSRPALILWVVLAGLLLLSTSSTAYVGLGILLVLLMAASVRTALRAGLLRQDLIVGVILSAILITVVGITLVKPSILDPIVRLSEVTLFEKANSASGQERSYWNEHSLQNVVETNGLGLGMGSSRASNWPTAVLSQLGIIGALLLIFLLISGLRDLGRDARAGPDREMVILYDSARATALAILAGGLLGAGSADPGILFFICIATTISCRHGLAVPAPAPAEPAPSRALRATPSH